MLIIRELQQNELTSFFTSFENEGWDNELAHIACLFQSYPNDFFIAYMDKVLVGFILAVKESEIFGTISNLLVLKEFRSQGFSKELLSFALIHLDGCQIAIESMQGKEAIYETFGFKPYYESSLFSFKPRIILLYTSHIKVRDVNLPSFLECNKRLNSLKKTSYLSCIFNSNSTLCKAVYKDQLISSYAILFPYKDGYKIALASSDINESLSLFSNLMQGLEDSIPIYVDISQLEPFKFPLIDLLNMKKISTTTKMYNKILK